MNHNYEHWIETFLGHPIDPLNPDPRRIFFMDIAHALSNQCRFSGHTREFYSVAQHSVHVSQHIKEIGGCPMTQLYGLMHDASEAYLVDMPTPVKRRMPSYRDAEAPLQRMIEQTLMPAVQAIERAEIEQIIKEADLAMLAAEARDLMANPNCHKEWKVLHGVKASKIKIFPEIPSVAKDSFIAQWQYLLRKVK